MLRNLHVRRRVLLSWLFGKDHFQNVGIYRGHFVSNIRSLPLRVSRFTTGQIWAAILLLSVVSIYFLFNIRRLDHNDFMYSAAPIVWSQNGGALYRDVPYVQAPLTFFLNLGIMKLFSIENVFMISRILSMVLVLAAVFCSAFALRRRKEPEFIFLYILLCLTNYYISTNSMEMGSYSQPLFLTSVALAVPTLGLAPWLGSLLAGILLGLSVSAKLNFLFLLPAFLLLLLLEAEGSWRTAVWFGIGAFFGILPLAYYAAVDFGSLFQNTVRFHYLVRQQIGFDLAHSAKQTLDELRGFAELMVVPAAFLVVRLVDQPLRERWRAGLLALSFLVCGTVMAVAGRTIFPQYLAPLAMLVMFFCLPDLGTPPERKRVLWIIGVTFFAIQSSTLLLPAAKAVITGDLLMLKAVKIQRQAARIAATLNNCDRRFYSAEPLFLLTEDVKYPAELGAGPFLLALRGGLLKPEDVGVDIDARLKEWAPNLVIYGYYGPWQKNSQPAVPDFSSFSEVDDKIRNYANERGFETMPVGVVENETITIAYDKACR
jgi:hypothetical protein